MAGGLIAGCGDGRDPWTVDPDGYDGLSTQTFSMLAAACVITPNTSTMSLTVADAELLYLTLRATDNMVIADAVTAGGAECAVPATYKIAIAGDTTATKTEKVFLDYINGPFALGTTAGSVVTPGITMLLGDGSSLVVRGSSGADKIYLGSTFSGVTLAHSWINVNGDTSPDVRFDGADDVKISTGSGADIISADGGNGTTGLPLASTITFQAFGGPDNDVLTGGKGTGAHASALHGGDGDDKFVQTATTVGADSMFGEKGVDTVDYSARTAAVTVTVCTSNAVTDACSCISTDTTCIGADDSTGCGLAEVTCESNCASGAGQAACIQACQDAEAPCVAACDATKAQCQLDCPLADDTQCTADDGVATEGDTVNDDIEIVLGGTAGDLIAARGAPCSDGATQPAVKCTLKGNKGDDIVIGSSVADLIDGGDGKDLLRGGLGDDTIIGGKDEDTVSYVDRTGAVSVSLDSANLWTAGQNGESGENDSIASDVEDLIGSGFNDFLRGNASANIIRGGAGADTIEGGAGKDTLYGEAGADKLYGGADNDFLNGGAGTDTLVGGDGDDLIDAFDSTTTPDTMIECDGNNDFAGTVGTTPGLNDGLAGDGVDSASHCELTL